MSTGRVKKKAKLTPKMIEKENRGAASAFFGQVNGLRDHDEPADPTEAASATTGDEWSQMQQWLGQSRHQREFGEDVLDLLIRDEERAFGERSDDEEDKRLPLPVFMTAQIARTMRTMKIGEMV